MSYSERLHIPPLWAGVGILFVASVAVAVVAYLPVWPAVTVCVLTALFVGLGLLAYSRTTLTVDEQAFTAGRYRVERAYIGGAEGFEGDQARRELGPGADHRAFLFTRPFISGVVRVDLADAADPHPYWLVSTRRPAELAQAIEELRAS